MNHTSMITIIVKHSEPEILEGETLQEIQASNGVTGERLTALELWQSWAVMARQLRAMLNPDGAAFAICDGVVNGLSMLGTHSHDEDIPKSIEGPLQLGEEFSLGGDGTFSVTGVHESGDLLIRWEPRG